MVVRVEEELLSTEEEGLVIEYGLVLARGVVRRVEEAGVHLADERGAQGGEGGEREGS